MLELKKLVFELDQRLKSGAELDKTSIQSFVDDAIAYFKKTKHFEYTGPIKLSSVALKLVDLKMDLDDVIKEIFDKRSDIEFSGTIDLIIEGEVKNEKKAT